MLLLVSCLISIKVNAQEDSLVSNNYIIEMIERSSQLGRDFREFVVTDHYISNEIEHFYLSQAWNGITVWNSQISFHGTQPDFKLRKGQYLRHISSLGIKPNFKISALEALSFICNKKSFSAPNSHTVLVEKSKNNQELYIRDVNIATNSIFIKKIYFIDARQNVLSAWFVEFEEKQSGYFASYIVHAESGEILEENNYTNSCHVDHLSCRDHKHSKETNDKYKSASLVSSGTYRVLALPVEAPHNGPRDLVMEPWNNNYEASPLGWHNNGSQTYTVTRGNNVDAYDDLDNTNAPTNGNMARVEGGMNLSFDFPLDTSAAPIVNRDASIANLFYTCNMVHDIMYNYGFDESSGNFQNNNFGATGIGSDLLLAEGLDGAGSCNANFSTPPDGVKPRMQMFLCGDRDGSLDNGVIIHEYAHGISNRLTGGPSNVSCLSNQEQMGEGWSDFYAYCLTIEAGDQGDDARGLGTWLVGEGPHGNGVRANPYTTDMTLNSLTYDDIKTENVPHGIGTVWATMLWEMTWNLIEFHGFDVDIYNGVGGNNIAVALVTEALKLQVCEPGFVDGRDAILLADTLLYNGANSCLIWKAFAKRGLGFSADQGSSLLRSDGSEAYDLPLNCSIDIVHYADKTGVYPGQEIMYSIMLENTTNIEFSNILCYDSLPNLTGFYNCTSGGTYDSINNVINWPMIDLAPDELKVYYFTVIVPSYVEAYGEMITNSFVAENADFVTYSENIPGTEILQDSSILYISTLQENLSCFGSNDGTAQVEAFSGTGNYSYHWSTGDTMNFIQNLIPGMYSVTVQDDSSSIIRTIEILDADLQLNLSSTFAEEGVNGTATAQLEGGTTPYHYNWENGDTISIIENLAAGHYSITAQDGNDCVIVDEIEVLTCSGITINLQLDNYPEDNSLIIRELSGNVIFDHEYGAYEDGELVVEEFCLIDGCYEIEIIDFFTDGLCSPWSDPKGYIQIVEAASGEVLLDTCAIGGGMVFDICFGSLKVSYETQEPSCTDEEDGSIIISAFAGTGEYTYEFSTGDTSDTLENIGAGIYYVTVSDGMDVIFDTIVLHQSIASVYKITDGGPGSLRFAMEHACPQDTVKFEIEMMDEILYLESPIEVSDYKMIMGHPNGLLTISGNNETRLFDIFESGTLSFKNLNLIDAGNTINGGAFFNQGNVILDSVTLQNMHESGDPKAWSGDGHVSIRGIVKLLN